MYPEQHGPVYGTAWDWSLLKIPGGLVASILRGGLNWAVSELLLPVHKPLCLPYHLGALAVKRGTSCRHIPYTRLTPTSAAPV